jgi:hypothetical protein
MPVAEAASGAEAQKGTAQADPAAQKASSGALPRSKARWRDRLMWLWPVVTLVVMAEASNLLGLVGTVITAAVTVTTLTLFVGEGVLGRRLQLAIAIVATLAVAAVLALHVQKVGPFAPAVAGTSSAATEAPVSPQILDLRGQRVTLAELKGKNLQGALLAGANLDGLDLYGMNLARIIAPGASFRRAILDRAILTGANLAGADFTGACLHSANLTGAKLAGVDAAGADVTGAQVSRSAVRSASIWPRSSRRSAVTTCG